MTVWLFILGLMSLYATASALFRFRHPAQAGFLVMPISWLTGEYALFNVGVQMVIAALLLGGTDGMLGKIGLAAFVISWVGLIAVRVIQNKARPAADRALAEALGADYLDRLPAERRSALRVSRERGRALLPTYFDKSRILIARDVAYGPARRNQLDIYQPKSAEGRLPVVLQVHGGAWVIGHKAQQAQPLIHRLASDGYVCVSINYRLAPKSRFPEPLEDVKLAIAWVRKNIGEYGGDPDLIVLTGGSAGGHLVSLAALTANDPKYQPGFESVDTSVAACIPFYGPADFANRFGIRGHNSTMEQFLKRTAMPGSVADYPELYAAMSPVEHVRPDAPPFLVIQGALDVLVWREETRKFVEMLTATSTNPVVYWEVPGAQHAFDTFNSLRSAVAVDTCERFLGWVVGGASAQS